MSDERKESSALSPLELKENLILGTTTVADRGIFTAAIREQYKDVIPTLPHIHLEHLQGRVYRAEFHNGTFIMKQAPYLRPGKWPENSARIEFNTARDIEKWCDVKVYGMRIRSEKPIGYVVHDNGDGYVLFEDIHGGFSPNEREEMLYNTAREAFPDFDQRMIHAEVLFRKCQLQHLREMVTKGTKMYFEDNNVDDGAFVIPQPGELYEFVRVDFEFVWAPWGPFSSKHMLDGDLEFINRWYLSVPEDFDSHGQGTIEQIDHFQSQVNAYLSEIQSIFGEEEYKRTIGQRGSVVL